MGKGIVKLGEGNWAVKDGNLLAAKETNGRFKNAEFTVARGTRATYVGRDGLIKESNLQNTNLVPSIITTENNNGGVINYISSNIYSSTSDGTSTSIIRPKFDFNTTSGKTYKLVITPTGAITGTVNFDFHDGSSYLFQDYDFTTTKEIYFTDNGNVFGSFDGQQTYSIDSFTISVQEVKTDTPRIDFTDNTDGHLLLEPESTNIVTYSEDFNETETDWNFSFNGTGSDPVETKKNISSPEGSLGVSKITLNGGGGTTSSDWSFINHSYTSTANDFTTSIYLKGENGGEKIFVDSNNGNDNIVTLTTSWERYEITRTHSLTSTRYIRIGLRGGTGSDMGETTVYAWGAQHEQLSYATSYIPTNGGQVTRDADTCTGAGEAADFNSSEGVLYAEINPIAVKSNSGYIGLLGASTAHRVIIGFSANSNDVTYFVVSGTTIANQSYDIGDMNQYLKIALKYKQDDFALWVNGTEVLTDASGTPNIDITHLGFYGYTTNQPFYGKVKAIRAYKEALSDSELTTLTS